MLRTNKHNYTFYKDRNSLKKKDKYKHDPYFQLPFISLKKLGSGEILRLFQPGVKVKVQFSL